VTLSGILFGAHYCSDGLLGLFDDLLQASANLLAGQSLIEQMAITIVEVNVIWMPP